MVYSFSGDHIVRDDVISRESSTQANKGHKQTGSKSTAIIPAHRNTTVVPKLYTAIENVIKERPAVWAEFVEMKMESVRSGQQELDMKALNSLRRCPSSTVSNLGAKLADRDKLWCEWAAKSDGGKVRAGETYGVLKPDERDRYERLSCNNIAKGWNPSCEEVRE